MPLAIPLGNRAARKHPAGAKELAEKSGISGEINGKVHPGLKPARIHLALFGG
jgi:hypothetical protein